MEDDQKCDSIKVIPGSPCPGHSDGWHRCMWTDWHNGKHSCMGKNCGTDWW